MFPVVAIVTYEIAAVAIVVYPAPNTPLVELFPPEIRLVATLKSPKSVASPVVAIVIYWITFTFPETYPPAHIPLVDDAHDAGTKPNKFIKSPKSVALPVELIEI